MPPSAARPPLADLAASDLDAAMVDVGIEAVFRRAGSRADQDDGSTVTIVLGAVKGAEARPGSLPPSRGGSSSQRRTVAVLLPGYLPTETSLPASSLGSGGHLADIKGGDYFEIDGVHVGLPTGQSVFLRVPDEGPMTYHGATWGFEAVIA